MDKTKFQKLFNIFFLFRNRIDEKDTWIKKYKIKIKKNMTNLFRVFVCFIFIVVVDYVDEINSLSTIIIIESFISHLYETISIFKGKRTTRILIIQNRIFVFCHFDVEWRWNITKHQSNTLIVIFYYEFNQKNLNNVCTYK